MPIWLIDLFGARQLDDTFLMIALMTAPAWIGMICFPNLRLVRVLAHPLVLPPLYSVVVLLLLWKSYQASLLPDPIAELNYTAAQGLARHPVAFLTFFCNFQIMNLILGSMMYQKTLRSRFRAPVELLLCWFIGAPVLIPFVIRLLVNRTAVR
jgi:hypothetical protein